MSGRGFNLGDYATVDDRITKYWEMHPKPEGSIQTEIIWVSQDGNSVAIKATVYMGDRILATGIAQEERGGKGANTTSWWENCETSAIGRALANMDMSLSKNRPSRQEMQKAERYEADDQQQPPAPPRRAPSPQPPPTPPQRGAVAPVAAPTPPNLAVVREAMDLQDLRQTPEGAMQWLQEAETKEEAELARKRCQALHIEPREFAPVYNDTIARLRKGA